MAYAQNPIPTSNFSAISESVASGLVAGAASFVGSASCLISAAQNQISTVAASGGGVRLPPATVGLAITINNNAATNAAKLYGDNGDTINGIAGTTGVSLAAGATAFLTCFVAGAWSGPVAAV